MPPASLPADPLAGLTTPDPLRRHWGPVTVRVAWELVVRGVRPRPAVLREVREHALWLLPAHANQHEAEATASLAAADWLARVAGTLGPLPRDDDAGILPSAAWRVALTPDGDPIHEAVVRLHYGDGVELAQLEARTGIAAPLVRAAREAVRGAARAVLEADGVSTGGWTEVRLDRMISRMANASGEVCPGPVGLATEPGRAHAEGCPRCARALRLMREGLLSPSDLFAPEGEVAPLRHEVELLALQVHPEARRARGVLLEQLGEAARLINGDVLVVDLAQRPDAEAVVREAVTHRQPSPDRVRLARARVPGRWGRKALLGPGPVELLERVQRLEWGGVEGADPLPEPTPEPPSAARWWMGALLVALLAVFAAVVAVGGPEVTAEVELRAQADAAGVRFDTEVDAFVDVLVVRGGVVTPLIHSRNAADKGAWATGDGAYRVDAQADAWVLVAGRAALEDTETIAAGLPVGGTTGAEVARRVKERYPRAAVAVLSPPR